MRVLFLLLYYHGPKKPANLYSDLIDEFVRNGNKVTVVSAASGNQPSTLVVEEGIEVLWVKTQKIFNVHPILKGIATVRIPYQLKRGINKFLGNRSFDLVITPTPPITFVDVVSWLKKKSPIKSYLILRDIFPQNARDLGMMKNPILFRYFRNQEMKLYQYSDYIGCMSQGNIDYIKNHNSNLQTEKLFLLPNWQRVYPVMKRDDSIKAKYGLSGKFVAIFGGNIGEPQKVENIISLALEYKENSNIVFLIMGEGTRKEYLKETVHQQKIENIFIKDKVDRNEYQELVHNADIGLISLNEKFTIPNIPSKTLSYFNAKLPILAVLDQHTDYGKILEDTESGLWSVAGDLKKYKSNFDKLYNNPELRQRMGENGYNFLINYLTPEIAYQNIMGSINEAKDAV